MLPKTGDGTFRSRQPSSRTLCWPSVSSCSLPNHSRRSPAPFASYWDQNSEADLAGYVLVWGTSTGVYSQSMTLGPSAVTHEVTSLANGTYYFAIRAFDAAGNHSGYSSEVQVVVSTPAISTPAITSVTPAIGPVTGGTDVTLVGSAFAPGATVQFGAAAGTVLQSTATSITVRTPASTAGAVDVRVTNPDGGTVVRAAGFSSSPPHPSPASRQRRAVTGGTASLRAACLPLWRHGAVCRRCRHGDYLTATSITVRTLPASTAGAITCV